MGVGDRTEDNKTVKDTWNAVSRDFSVHIIKPRVRVERMVERD